MPEQEYSPGGVPIDKGYQIEYKSNEELLLEQILDKLDKIEGRLSEIEGKRQGYFIYEYHHPLIDKPFPNWCQTSFYLKGPNIQ